MKMFIAALSVLICVFSDTQAIAQTQSALLIGINVYQPEGTQVQHPAGCTSGRCVLPYFENLSGADNDAQALQSANTITKQRWIYVLDINSQGQGELLFEGVASRGTRGMESPLQKLLTDTSSSTRGPRPVIPTNWGINIRTVRSVPKEADK
ncbi:MAG TPA: hypothetical protein VKF63_01415 [Terracidiphilus sp.]|nr:hypothetical protein [Terracidiphilus sp.]